MGRSLESSSALLLGVSVLMALLPASSAAATVRGPRHLLQEGVDDGPAAFYVSGVGFVAGGGVMMGDATGGNATSLSVVFTEAGPADDGAQKESTESDKAATVPPDGLAAKTADVSIMAGAPAEDSCQVSCGTSYIENPMCTSGWEGQSALCGRGFSSIPGLEPKDNTCLRCISGVCGECPAGFIQVEEMGICRAAGQCNWAQCSMASSCSDGYTAIDSNVCRVGSYFMTQNYCCKDYPKLRCCQPLPCEVYEEDCEYWGCDPACQFAMYSKPQQCSNPYNSSFTCGMGFSLDGLDVNDLEWLALKPETGTCLEMVEVCGSMCPEDFFPADCPWEGCSATADTCMHDAGVYDASTNSFTKNVTHCWRRHSCGVENAPAACARPVAPVIQPGAPSIYEVITGENANNCPLFWDENPKCTALSGGVNKCGEGLADAVINPLLAGQQGTCFQELQICGTGCPDGYEQIPCIGGSCPTCNADGRKVFSCARRQACIPLFAQCGAPTEEQEADDQGLDINDAYYPPPPPAQPLLPSIDEGIPSAASVKLPSAAGLAEDDRGFAALRLEFYFVDLSVSLLEEDADKFNSAFEGKLLKASKAVAVEIVSIVPGSVVLTCDLEYNTPAIPEDNFVTVLMDEPETIFTFIDWHKTIPTLGRIVTVGIEYLYLNPSPPPPPPSPSPPAPSPPQPGIPSRAGDEDTGLEDLQPIDNVDVPDSLDGSQSSNANGTEGISADPSGGQTKSSTSSFTLALPMAAIIGIIVGCLLLVLACVFLVYFLTGSAGQRWLAGRSPPREEPQPQVENQNPTFGLDFGNSIRQVDGSQTARSATLEFVAPGEDPAVTLDDIQLDDCPDPSSGPSTASEVLVNATGLPGPPAALSMSSPFRTPPRRHIVAGQSPHHQRQATPGHIALVSLPPVVVSTPPRTPQQQNVLMEQYHALEVPFNSLIIQQSVGRSSYKTTFRGFWNGYIPVAILKVNLPSDDDVPPTSVLASVQPHPNVLQLFGISYDPQGVEHLVCEFIPKGALNIFLIDNPQSPDVKLEIACQICMGMRHLTTEGVVHGNLAARNVLVESLSPLLVKVADFGMMTHALRNSPSSARDELPLRWVPPEVWQRGEWSEKSDVWAFGVTLWEIHSFTIPYGRLTSDSEALLFLENGGRLPRPSSCHEALYNVMQACWTADPEHRPTFAQLVEILNNLKQTRIF